MTSAFSWQNSIRVCPASFRISRPNLPVTPGVSWLPTFAFQSPIIKRTFLGVFILKGLVSFHRTIQLQLLQHYWSGHRLGLLWYWLVCLGNEQRSFCHFWDCIQEQVSSCGCTAWSSEQRTGDTPHPRLGAKAVRRYTIFKVRNSSCALLEQPWIDIPRPRYEKPQ